MVSVIILNYNGGEFLKKCVESVLNQSYEDIEIIVVDNASIDNSVDIVEKLYPRIRVIRNKENLGFAEGNNIGIRVANGNEILLLNNDALLDKHWVENALSTLNTYKDCGIIGGKVLSLDETRKVLFSGGRLYEYLGLFGGYRDINCIRKVDWITGCAIMFKKEIIEKIGFWDKGYFLFFEDVDFCLRARRLGYNVLYNPGMIARHKLGKAARKLGHDRLRHEYYSKFRFILKNLPAGVAILSILIHLFIITFYNYIKGEESLLIKLKALLSSFKDWKREKL